MNRTFTHPQLHNARLIVAEAKAQARAKAADGLPHDKETAYARRLSRLSLMCALAESNLYNYASPAVKGSLQFPHDIVASVPDHLSVGVFQQQVPMWGPVERCQDVTKAARHFLDALQTKFPGGLVTLAWNPSHMYRGDFEPIEHLSPWQQIQRVQGSWYNQLSGSRKYGTNYEAQRARSLTVFNKVWGDVR